MSSFVQRIPSEQSPQLPAQRKELSRKRERDSEEPAESETESQNHGIGKQSKVTKANSKRFPCPFFLRNPATYGRENGCSSYSRRIETVIRHHVLGKHRKEYQEAGNGKDEIFEAVEKLVGKSGSNKHKAPEELWRLMYKALFEVDSSEDDSIPDPSIQTSARAMRTDNVLGQLVQCITANRDFPFEVLDLLHQVDTLRRQRTQAKDDIRRAAEKDIAAIHDRVAVDLQQVNAHYDEQVNNARSRLTQKLTSGSHTLTEEVRSVSSVASYSLHTSMTGLAHEPSLAAAPLTDVSRWSHETPPAGFHEAPAWGYGFQNRHTGSASETAGQLPSDEGYNSLPIASMCEHKLSGDDPWCDECFALLRDIASVSGPGDAAPTG